MKKIILIFCTVSGIISFSQDIHFSQNFTDRLYFNPSEIGLIGKGEYRFSMQRKSQWISVGTPFSTFSSSFENKNIYKKINLGMEFFSDKSGDSKLTLNQLNVALSTKFKILRFDTLSLGFMFGFGQKKIDYNNLIFEENENFVTNNFIYPDMAFGINYFINSQKINSYKIGFSSYHFNSPNNSFYDDDRSKLPIKNNFNFKGNYKISKKKNFIYEIIITKQSTEKEILFGVRPTIRVDEYFLYPLLYYRINDSYIIGCGIEKNNLQANIIYDLNTSDLSEASNYRGGFEFSIIYVWKKKKKEKIKITEEKCPKYL